MARSDPNQPPLISKTMAPAPELTGLVEYWSVGVRRPFEMCKLRFSPCGDVNLVFNFKASLTRRVPLVIGAFEGAMTFKFKASADMLGVKFMPGGFYSLFKVTPKREMFPLKAVIGRNSLRFERIFKMSSEKLRLKFLNSVLGEFARTAEPMDPIVKGALAHIYAHKGMASVHKLAADAGCSERWFSYIFKKWVGTTPRSFCGAVRFLNACRELKNRSKPVAVAQNTGYADQSHLNRAFKVRTGCTPARLNPKYYKGDSADRAPGVS